METKGYFQFEIIINVLALSDSFEYLCYGSMTAIRNILFVLVPKTFTDVRFKDSPRAVSVNQHSLNIVYKPLTR